MRFLCGNLGSKICNEKSNPGLAFKSIRYVNIYQNMKVLKFVWCTNTGRSWLVAAPFSFLIVSAACNGALTVYGLSKDELSEKWIIWSWIYLPSTMAHSLASLMLLGRWSIGDLPAGIPIRAFSKCKQKNMDMRKRTVFVLCLQMHGELKGNLW